MAHVRQSRPDSDLDLHFKVLQTFQAVPSSLESSTVFWCRGRTGVSRWGRPAVQRFRGGLVFKAHRLCVSLNSRRVSNKEEAPLPRAATRVSFPGRLVLKHQWLQLPPLSLFGIFWRQFPEIGLRDAPPVIVGGIIIIIDFLFITLTWCDKIKLSNLLLPRQAGVETRGAPCRQRRGRWPRTTGGP